MLDGIINYHLFVCSRFLRCLALCAVDWSLHHVARFPIAHLIGRGLLQVLVPLLMPFPPARSVTLPRCAVKANICTSLPSRSVFTLCYPLPSSPPRSSRPVSSAGHGARSLGRCAPSVAFSELPLLSRTVSRRPFSASSPTMAATKIDGTQIAKSIREGLKNEIQKIQETNPRFKPSLVIFQGSFPARLIALLRTRTAILTYM